MGKRFYDLLTDIAKATTNDELTDIVVYRQDGIDGSYIKGKITYQEHEILYGLVSCHKANTEGDLEWDSSFLDH